MILKKTFNYHGYKTYLNLFNSISYTKHIFKNKNEKMPIYFYIWKVIDYIKSLKSQDIRICCIKIISKVNKTTIVLPS